MRNDCHDLLCSLDQHCDLLLYDGVHERCLLGGIARYYDVNLSVPVDRGDGVYGAGDGIFYVGRLLVGTGGVGRNRK